MIDIKCSSFCCRNIIKFAICYLVSSFCLEHIRSYIFLIPLFLVTGNIFAILAFIYFYRLFSVRVELYGNILTLRYNCFKHDCIDLVNDSNYKVIINNRRIIVTHYGKQVVILRYFSNYNLFRYYISYYAR